MGFNAKWKREIVPDHKFDFINVLEYRATGFLIRFKYMMLYIGVLISIGVHCANIYTAITMLLATGWTNSIYTKCGDDCVLHVGFVVQKWIFVGCIIVSFLLLAYEANKARKVIASRDISYAFTNLMANHYYSLRSYPHFCFFDHIQSSTKRSDDFAFFVFFTFKSWKTLLVTDAPRQVINALTLYSFGKVNKWQTSDISLYYDGNWVTAVMLITMIFTVLVFASSLVLLISAAFLYVPLLIYVQGNLKEYCCHKIDKRITELIKRKQKQRIARNAAMEKRIAASGNGGGQPTLPNVSLDEEGDEMKKPFRMMGAAMDGYAGQAAAGSTTSLMPMLSAYDGRKSPSPYGQRATSPFDPEYNAYGAPPMAMYQPPNEYSSFPSSSVGYPPSQHPIERSRSFASSSSGEVDDFDNYYSTNVAAGGFNQPSLSSAYLPSQVPTRQPSYPPRTANYPPFSQGSSSSTHQDPYPQRQQAYYPPSTSQSTLYDYPSAKTPYVPPINTRYLLSHADHPPHSPEDNSELAYASGMGEVGMSRPLPVATGTAGLSPTGYPVEKAVYKKIA